VDLSLFLNPSYDPYAAMQATLGVDLRTTEPLVLVGLGPVLMRHGKATPHGRGARPNRTSTVRPTLRSGGATHSRLHSVSRANRVYPPAAYGDYLRSRARLVHGQHVRADQHEVRRNRAARHLLAWYASACAIMSHS
jgi:hypothetical protein